MIRRINFRVRGFLGCEVFGVISSSEDGGPKLAATRRVRIIAGHFPRTKTQNRNVSRRRAGHRVAPWTAPTIHFAMSGKTPRSTNEPMSAGERIPWSDSMRASWVPALTLDDGPREHSDLAHEREREGPHRSEPITRLMTKNGNAGTSRRVNR